jgi:phage pi2 protein 07
MKATFLNLFKIIFLVLLYFSGNAQLPTININDANVNTNKVTYGLKSYEKDTVLVDKKEFGINLNQGYFTDNWSGGAKNSVAVGFLFNYLREVQNGKNILRNDFQSQYGIVSNAGQRSNKNIDRLYWDFKYGRMLSKDWRFIANVNFLSQFSPGYKYSIVGDSLERKDKISGFLTPAYLTEMIGFEYKPTPSFFVNISPAALRQTIVADTSIYSYTPDQKNYGVDIGKKLKTEVALVQIVANYDKDIAKNMNLKVRYLMYATYKNIDSPDNRLDLLLTAKFKKYLNANIGAILVYDDDQSSRIQYAQSLYMGFLYVF